MKNISILGSTGSIGTQALDVIRNRKDDFKVTAISASSNYERLYEQAVEFNPLYVVIMDKDGYTFLKHKLANYDIKVLCGVEGLNYISCLDETDILLTSIVGMAGLVPTVAAIRAGKTIALANKETLVAGGEIIKSEISKSHAKLIPVDSEHCAIFQCLMGHSKDTVRNIILTASGGPFRGYHKNELINVTPQMAVKHPRWKMGKKISVDSATLMNKGLEVIEAHFLFDADYEHIKVIVHPESIIHSMVEYIDGSIIAQMSNTDMRHPIQFAFDYPEKNASQIGYLDLIAKNKLTFESPDTDTFECLKLGIEAGKIGGSMPAAMNAANEEAVKLFLNGKIKFLQIAEIIKEVMKSHKVERDLNIEKILQIESDTRKYVNLLVK
jgi:1-deoxy-D-xylulose-5-phosphate reductoisomerase